jgi:hypothetical protein
VKSKTADTRPHKTVHTMNALFGGARVDLAQTCKPVTPFGGLAVFAEFLRKIGWSQALAVNWPFTYESPNAIPPQQTFTVFLFAVLSGASRFAHAGLLRADMALREMLGIRRCASDDAVRAMFGRFGLGEIQRLFRPLWAWCLMRLPTPSSGYTLDVDSSVFVRWGEQEGAKLGYNPTRHGSPSHHPLLAVLAQCHFVLHAWLRRGDTTANSGVIDFLSEAFELAERAGVRISGLRADCGFYGQKLFQWLENRGIAYLIVARKTGRLLRSIHGIKTWKATGENGEEVGEFTAAVGNWKVQRRFLVLRRLAKENETQPMLLRVSRYVYRVLVTNRSEDAAELWREYDGRAQIEQRLRELKDDLHADNFCMRSFYASEAAFLGVLCLYNLLGEFQRATTPDEKWKQPATLRSQVFVCGAVLGRRGRDPVLYFSMSWGGLDQRKPLLDALLHWPPPIPPLLKPKQKRHPPPRAA